MDSKLLNKSWKKRSMSKKGGLFVRFLVKIKMFGYMKKIYHVSSWRNLRSLVDSGITMKYVIVQMLFYVESVNEEYLEFGFT